MSKQCSKYNTQHSFVYAYTIFWTPSTQPDIVESLVGMNQLGSQKPRHTGCDPWSLLEINTRTNPQGLYNINLYSPNSRRTVVCLSSTIIHFFLLLFFIQEDQFSSSYNFLHVMGMHGITHHSMFSCSLKWYGIPWMQEDLSSTPYHILHSQININSNSWTFNL